MLKISLINRSFNWKNNVNASNLLNGISRRFGLLFCSTSESHVTKGKPPGPLVQYRAFVKEGKLQYDPNQESVASQLDELLQSLDKYDKEMKAYHVRLSEWENSRDEARRKLLMEEAEAKQEGGIWSTKRTAVINKWISRRTEGVEPGSGRMVSFLNRENKLHSLVGSRPTAPSAPKGLYIYGSVGSGKTMLMDMFYGATRGVIEHRRRFHFHEAMLEIHEHMHKVWKKQNEERPVWSGISNWINSLPFDMGVKEWLAAEEKYEQEARLQNILSVVADKFLMDRQSGQGGATILCFDEIQTVDVFAVVALSGIVSRLLNNGTVLVATSNRAPEDLNQDGMQKKIFQKFLRELGRHCQTVPIGCEVDYRCVLAKDVVNQVHYFCPIKDEFVQGFEKAWNEITSQEGGSIRSITLNVMFGRTLVVPESCGGIARFTFEYLCARAVGAADYIAIAKNYHTVFISGIPIMSMRIRDKARRFITLIDELYNHHCRLLCTASVPVDELFQGTDEGTLFDMESFQFETDAEGARLRRDVLASGSAGENLAPTAIISLLSGEEEMFGFRRAVSRLIEMQTPTYLEGVQHHSYFEQHSNVSHSC